MSRMIPLAIAFVSLGFATAAAADISPNDRKFIEDAAMGGIAEVELGKVATARGSSERVRQFGQQMINDHRKANTQLKRIASAKAIELPTALDAKHRKDVDELRKKDAAAFDREYMQMMVKDHRKDLAEFRKQAKGAKDPDIKAFAATAWPTLRVHLELAEATMAGLAPPKKPAR